jgi:hypothetical protein
MRTSPLLHALVLSLVALVGCAGPDTDTNPNGTVDNPDGTTNPGDTGFEAVIAMSADTGTFMVEGEPIDPDLCEGNSCEYPVHTADGYEYDLNLDMSGFLTVTHTVRVENDDNGELFEVDWTGEGDYGLDFGWWCTDEDGDSVFLESFIGVNEEGSDVILVDGMMVRPVLTGLNFSGDDGDGSIYTGSINLDTNSIHFEWWYDGELWKERDYTDCHE